MERFFASKSKGNKLLSFIELGRPWNGLASAMTGLMGYLLVSYSFDYLAIIGMFVSLFVIFMAGTAVNDIIDINVDKVNMPFRPLQRKSINYDEAIKFIVLMYFMGLFIAYLVNFKFFICSIIFLVSTIFYSMPPLSFEIRGFLAQLYLAFASFFIPAYSGTVLGLNSFFIPMNILFALSSFTLLYCFVVIIKDFKDIKGDRISGKRTFIIRVGESTAKKVMIAGTIITYPLTVFLFYRFFESILFVLLSAILFIMLLRSEKDTKKPETDFQNARLSILALLVTIILYETI